MVYTEQLLIMNRLLEKLHIFSAIYVYARLQWDFLELIADRTLVHF